MELGAQTNLDLPSLPEVACINLVKRKRLSRMPNCCRGSGCPVCLTAVGEAGVPYA